MALVRIVVLDGAKLLSKTNAGVDVCVRDIPRLFASNLPVLASVYSINVILVLSVP